jgi:hypothetical protein
LTDFDQREHNEFVALAEKLSAIGNVFSAGSFEAGALTADQAAGIGLFALEIVPSIICH